MIKQLYFKYKELINYIIVGGLTTVISLGSYYLLVFTLLNPNNALQLQLANIISWIAAVTFAFFTNRKFVFESKNEKELLQAVKFYASRVTTLLLDMFFMFLLVTVFVLNDKFSKVAVQLIIMVVNYLLSKFFVFRKVA